MKNLLTVFRLPSNYKKFAPLIGTLALAFILNGCATMIEGSTQKINVHCEPSDNVFVVSDGKETPFSGGLLSLSKKRDLHFVTFKEEHHYPSTIAFNRVINPIWPVANLIWLPGYPIALFVDWYTGSIFKIEPLDIHVVLRTKGEDTE